MSEPREDGVRTIGILGAGKVGLVLARLAARAGYDVLIAGSGDPSEISLTAEILAPGARATDRETLVAESDIVILAFPLSGLPRTPPGALTGKVTIDAMNYWPDVDGTRDDLRDLRTSTSETVQSYFVGARIVKAFNHIGYHDLEESARPTDSPDRVGIAIAGDDASAVRIVADVIAALGFDAVPAGRLAAGIKFEPGSELFGAHGPAVEVIAALNHFDATAHGRRIAAARTPTHTSAPA